MWVKLGLTLRSDGAHLFQSELGVPVSMRAQARPEHVRMDGAGIVLDLVFSDYLEQPDGTQRLPSRRFRAHVSMAPSQTRAASARSAVLAVE